MLDDGENAPTDTRWFWRCIAAVSAVAIAYGCGGNVVVDPSRSTTTDTSTTSTDTSETDTSDTSDTVTETETFATDTDTSESVSCHDCACQGSGNSCNQLCDSFEAGTLNFCSAGMTTGTMCAACVAAACGGIPLSACD